MQQPSVCSNSVIYLQHWEPTGQGAKWKSSVNPSKIGFGQAKVSTVRIFDCVIGIGSLGDREERRPPYQEPERDLMRSGRVRSSDFLEHGAALRV
jgi:hypothetical protein